MIVEGIQNSVMCRSADVSAYIDGELSPDAEIAFEMHIADCPDCLGELNVQKNLLRELDLCLTTGELELPRDFAKTVVVNAESGVSGLRCPNERFRAVFICSGLLLVALFALGADAGRTIGLVGTLGEKAVAVVGMVVHFAYDIALGAAIISRSLGAQFGLGSPSFLFLLAAGTIGLIVLSRLLFRLHRGPLRA